MSQFAEVNDHFLNFLGVELETVRITPRNDLAVMFSYQTVSEEMVLADRTVDWPAITCVH